MVRVLMFGWEFPPFYSGGLGIACYGLTKGLCNKGASVTFVMPHGPGDIKADFVKLLVANNLNYKHLKLKFKKIDSILTPYMTSKGYEENYERLLRDISSNPSNKVLYGKNIYEEVYRFSQKAKMIALSEEYDIIHCHDWMTYPAAIEAKKISGKPMVAHIHATEFDRTGGNGVNQYVYDIERKGFEWADRIFAVSNFVKQNLIKHYGIPADKITVVYNAIEFTEKPFVIKNHEKVVLFLGRITLQKGPDYFVEAAKRVLDIDPDVKFIIAGTGDMEVRMIERVAELGIGNKVLFAGFVTGADVDRMYKLADVYVMPSVSEPFGLTPLESLRNDTPVIISKQSGVSEVLKNALKVDFWDVDELANKIVAILNYRALHHELRTHGALEVQKFNWNVPAQQCIDVYNELLHRGAK